MKLPFPVVILLVAVVANAQPVEKKANFVPEIERAVDALVNGDQGQGLRQKRQWGGGALE